MTRKNSILKISNLFKLYEYILLFMRYFGGINNPEEVNQVWTEHDQKLETNVETISQVPVAINWKIMYSNIV